MDINVGRLTNARLARLKLLTFTIILYWPTLTLRLVIRREFYTVTKGFSPLLQSQNAATNIRKQIKWCNKAASQADIVGENACYY